MLISFLYGFHTHRIQCANISYVENKLGPFLAFVQINYQRTCKEFVSFLAWNLSLNSLYLLLLLLVVFCFGVAAVQWWWSSYLIWKRKDNFSLWCGRHQSEIKCNFQNWLPCKTKRDNDKPSDEVSRKVFRQIEIELIGIDTRLGKQCSETMCTLTNGKFLRCSKTN